MTNGLIGLGALLRSDEDPVDSPADRRRAKDAVRAFFKAVATRDREAFSAAVTDDVIHEIPFSESGSSEPGKFRHFAGKAAVVDFWMGVSNAGIKAAAPEDVELSITADGSRIFIEQRGNMTMPDGKFLSEPVCVPIRHPRRARVPLQRVFQSGHRCLRVRAETRRCDRDLSPSLPACLPASP